MIPSPRRLTKFYYTAHIVTILGALGFIFIAYFTSQEESRTLGKFNLNITHKIVSVYYGCGGLLIFAAGCGFMAQRKSNKPVLWIIFCLLMAILALIEIAIAGSAVAKVKDYTQTIPILMEQMELYETNETITRNWDNLQTKYNCCGVNNYGEWQSVPFGRTSLNVPSSCCLDHLKNMERCGHNVLPFAAEAKHRVYIDGCLPKVIKTIDRQLYIMGIYGFILSTLQIMLVSFSCFLIVTKKL